MLNKLKPSITEDSFHLVLSSYLAPTFRRSNKENSYQMSINNIWVNEQIRNSRLSGGFDRIKEIGFLELELGFFKKIDGVVMDYGVCKKSIDYDDVNVTNGHARRLTSALHK
jgi:hypothetical protein